MSGTPNRRAPLGEATVVAILHDYHENCMFQREIREKYGVSQWTLYKLLDGSNWVNVPRPDNSNRPPHLRYAKRHDRVYTVDGKTKTLAEWARHLGLHYASLSRPSKREGTIEARLAKRYAQRQANVRMAA